MQTKFRVMMVLIFSSIGIVAYAQTQGQSAGEDNSQARSISGFASQRGQAYLFPGSSEQNPKHDRNREIQNKIKAATKNLKSAESDSARADAKDELMSALGEDYEARLSDYEEYLDDLEKQLGEMREKLKRRRRAKDEMVKLRMQVLEAEADDLGWPSRVNNGRFGYFGSLYKNGTFTEKPATAR